MKIHTLSKLLFFIMIWSLIPLAQTNAETTLGLRDLSPGSGNHEGAGNKGNPKIFDSTTDPNALNDVAWSDGGYSGVVDISFVATTSGGDSIQRGGAGAFGIRGGTNTLIEPAEGTITLSDIVFTYVSGDTLDKIATIEFAAVYIGNWTAGETGTLNMTTISTGDSVGITSVTGRNVLDTNASSVVVDSTNGAFSINGVDIAVTSTSIDWGVATNVSEATDVITTGTLIEAFNAGEDGVVSRTVNGVTFVGTGALLDLSAGANAFTGSTTNDAAYDALLNDIDFGGGTGTISLQVGGGNLQAGVEYLVQVWYADTRNPTRVSPVGDGATTSNTVLLSATGQYAIGTFTAGGTTQTITLESPSFGQAHINAYLIRTVSSSSPASPDAPANLVATPGNGNNSLIWDVNTQAGFFEYRVKRSTNLGGPYTQIDTTTTNSYLDSTVTNETTYYYVVTKVNTASVESAVSNEVSSTPSSTIEVPPNFLFIIADDMDTYAINAYRTLEPAETKADGSPYSIDTPHIDRLATEGMIFHQARLMGSDRGAVCTPSRACIMTGKNTWERESGVTAATTFPGIFNRGVRTGNTDLPYATYRTCKRGNSYPTANDEFTIVNDATKRGNTDENGSEWHGDRGLEYITDWQNNHRPNGKPFLMYLGFSHPHDARNSRELPDLVGRYGSINTTIPGSIILNTNAPPLPYNHLPINEAVGIPTNYPFHPFDHGHLNIRDENAAEGMLQYRTEAVTRNEIGRNFACVDWMDQQLGRVFDKLEDPNGDGDTSDSIIDNTYIVFTSDHGIAIGRHGLQGKQNLYEHTWRVPYIVRGPGIAANTRSNALVYLHDTFPTFCDIAGLDIPSTIDANDGQSFKDVLEGRTSTHRDYLYGLYAGGDKPGMRSVTDGRFKLIKYDVGNNTTQVTQLFDLQVNPFELLPEHGTPNLANQTAYSSIRQRLEEELTKQRIENADPHAMLGDRTLIRFENNLNDSFPYGNNGTAQSGTGGPLPAFSNNVPNSTDYVLGSNNDLSLDFEQDNENYVRIEDNPSLDFGDNPFTIEASVKLEILPTGNNAESTMPMVMKKVTNASDSELDYMFLATAGEYGDTTTFNKLALRLGSTTIISSLAIPDTSWHHISVAFNPVNNTVRFTLDDQSDTQMTTAIGTANNGPLIIGAHFNSFGVIDYAFDGMIDELSITDGFLSITELQPLGQVITLEDFKITQAALSNDGSMVNLSFTSTDTRLYRVQRSYTLEVNSWENVRTFISGTTGMGETTVQDINVDPLRPKAFYRIVTE